MKARIFLHARSICVVTQQYKSVISGVGLHARNLVAGLQRDGHRVTLLTQVTQHVADISGDIDILTVPASSLQSSQARWIPLAWHFARALQRVDATRRFDIVHFTDARESLFFAGRHPVAIGNANDYYAAQIQPIGYYRKHYADAWQRYLYYMLVHQCERIALRRLEAVISNSDYTQAAVQAAYSLDNRRLFKCPKCIDLNMFPASARTYRSGELILFAGGNMQRKGLASLIRAAPYVLVRQPRVRFLVVGTDPSRPKMQALCRELGVAEYFEFKDWMPNEQLRGLYRHADVFVMPSLAEAFGVALLEAMASGTPVVAARVGGIPELVQHGANGLLVEPEDPRALADALLMILQDPPLATRLGTYGQETAQHFGIERMLACTYRVYEAALGMTL